MSPRVTINGVTGRMILDKYNPFGEHVHLPAYSGTCDIYFYPDKDGKATQAKLYDGNKMQLDFDCNHTHQNKSKGKVTDTFPEGVVHVQEYTSTKVWSQKYKKYVDKFKRKSNKARLMTDEEIKKYGPIITNQETKEVQGPFDSAVHAMREAGMTGEQLADALGVSQSRISDLINDRAEPTLKVARMLYKVLHINPIEMLEEAV